MQNDEEQPGYRRRARLSILCVQYVLPVWEAAYPDDTDTYNMSPQRMLEICEGLLRGQLNPTEALQASNRFSVVLEEVLSDNPAASYVGYASIGAVAVVVHDYDPKVPLDYDDGDLTPDDWDDSYRTDLAASGGEPGEDNSSNQRRREFWQWYLEQAVPHADESVTD